LCEAAKGRGRKLAPHGTDTCLHGGALTIHVASLGWTSGHVAEDGGSEQDTGGPRSKSQSLDSHWLKVCGPYVVTKLFLIWHIFIRLSGTPSISKQKLRLDIICVTKQKVRLVKFLSN
jgi:hypothetical protein